jgi:hypothetical protein
MAMCVALDRVGEGEELAVGHLDNASGVGE